jgi:hypothetical protein
MYRVRGLHPLRDLHTYCIGVVTDSSFWTTGRTASEGQSSSAALISAIQTGAPINAGSSGGSAGDPVRVSNSGEPRTACPAAGRTWTGDHS